MFRRFILHYYRFGTHRVTEAERTRVQTGNLVALLGSSTTALYAIAHLVIGAPLGAVLDAVCALAYLINFPLVARGKFTAAALASPAILVFDVTMLVALFGPESGFQNYLIMFGPLALVLFDAKQRALRWATIGLPALIYAATFVAPWPPLLGPQTHEVYRLMTMATLPTIAIVLLLIQAIFLSEIQRRETALEAAALTDALTGLPNRRHAIDHARNLFTHMPRAASMAVLMVDLDHFKQVNDRHGHAVGDALLQAVAGVLQGRLRHEDLVARMGGEEFLVVADVSARGDEIELAEALRERVAGVHLPLADGSSLSCTASVGVALRTPADTDLDALLARADRALYEAKARGRNRVQVDGFDAAHEAAHAAAIDALSAASTMPGLLDTPEDETRTAARALA